MRRNTTAHPASAKRTNGRSTRAKNLKPRSGRGTITRLPSGRFRVQIMIGGQRVGETFDTPKECDEWIDQLLQRVDAGAPLDGPRTSVADLLQRFLDVCQTRGLAISTVRIYRWAGEYVRAAFGRTPVGELSVAKLDAFFASLKKGARRLRADGSQTAPVALAPKSIGHIHGLLSAMLNQAIDWQLISQNVALRAKRPKVPKYRHQYWTPPQIVAFLDAIKGERLEAAFWVILTCGLRRGELCGLRDEDLRQVEDPETGEEVMVLFVQRKLIREPDYGLQASAPKADSARVLALEPRVVQKIEEWHARREQEKLLAGGRWQDSGYLFTSRVGTPIEPRNLNRTFQRLLETHGFGHLKLHELRHSFARALLATNVSSKAVQQALGHATHAMTVDLYGDMILGTERQVARSIGKILDTGRTDRGPQGLTPR